MGRRIDMTVTTVTDAQLAPKDYASDQEVRWCPGCGDYAILKAVQTACAELAVSRERTVFVTGIGCAGRRRALGGTDDRQGAAASRRDAEARARERGGMVRRDSAELRGVQRRGVRYHRRQRSRTRCAGPAGARQAAAVRHQQEQGT